jgi:hypothetical protein
MTYQPVDLTSAKVLADSVWQMDPQIQIPGFGEPWRITTFELTFPRCVLSEFNTHCQLARNSASSRAIPVEKMIRRAMDTPFVPLQFSKNQKGMAASEYWVPGDPEYDEAAQHWLNLRNAAVKAVSRLVDLGVHKQDANRLLEPWMWHTVIATATWEKWDWPNFIRLRASDNADPKISHLAYMLRDAAEQSTPRELRLGDWHLPMTGYPGDEELSPVELVKVATARIARVSYLTHDGRRDPEADLRLYNDLQTKQHLSPFEHPASATPGRFGKFTGWRSARTWVENGMEIEAS